MASEVQLTSAAQASPDAVTRLLDDPATLRAAHDDPAGFVEHDGLLVIDEIQLAAELFRSIKVAVDTDPRPGRFLLTGSAQVLALRQLPDALPGRMEIIELWPFSQGEIDHSPDAFIDAAFAHGPALSRTSALRKRDYLERVVRGGYPEAVRRSPRRRAAFFDSYLTNPIERDVKELAVIERRSDLRRLLALLAGRSGGLLVPATLAAESGIPRTTLNRYLELLTAVFLIKQVLAWSASQTQRAIGTPKLAFVDAGIASHLRGQDATRLGEPDGAAGANDRDLRTDGTGPPAHQVFRTCPPPPLPHRGCGRGGRRPGNPGRPRDRHRGESRRHRPHRGPGRSTPPGTAAGLKARGRLCAVHRAANPSLRRPPPSSPD